MKVYIKPDIKVCNIQPAHVIATSILFDPEDVTNIHYLKMNFLYEDMDDDTNLVLW